MPTTQLTARRGYASEGLTPETLGTSLRKNDPTRCRHYAIRGMAAVAVDGCLRGRHVALTPM